MILFAESLQSTDTLHIKHYQDYVHHTAGDSMASLASRAQLEEATQCDTPPVARDLSFEFYKSVQLLQARLPKNHPRETQRHIDQNS